MPGAAPRFSSMPYSPFSSRIHAPFMLPSTTVNARCLDSRRCGVGRGGRAERPADRPPATVEDSLVHAADPDRPFAAQAASSASVPFPRRLAARFGAASATREVPWERPALALVLLIAAFLDIFRLSQEGYGNT